MKQSIHAINKKIADIQIGLIRYRHNDDKVSLHANILACNDESLHCTISGETPAHRLLNKHITLLQKDNDNYLYVDGFISKVIRAKKTVVYIAIKKAFWFIRRRKGSITTLHEKYYYENNPVRLAC